MTKKEQNQRFILVENSDQLEMRTDEDVPHDRELKMREWGNKLEGATFEYIIPSEDLMIRHERVKEVV